MATYHFNLDGSLVSADPSGNAAVVGGRSFPLTGSQLTMYAATIYAEASFMGLVQQINPNDPEGEMQRETFAIAYSMFNYASAKKQKDATYTFDRMLVDKNYTHAIGSPAYNEYFSAGGDSIRKKYATQAIIKMFTRNTADMLHVIQTLDGGPFWDGSDIYQRFRDHYRAKQGFKLSDPAHGRLYQNVTVVQGTQVIETVEGNNKWIQGPYTFMSTMTAGGTIFWKFMPGSGASV
jgi:hypothetical protein